MHVNVSGMQYHNRNASSNRYMQTSKHWTARGLVLPEVLYGNHVKAINSWAKFTSSSRAPNYVVCAAPSSSPSPETSEVRAISESSGASLDTSSSRKQPEKEPENKGPLGTLIKLLSKYQYTSWLAGFMERFMKKAGQSANNGEGARIVRIMFLLAMFCCVVLFREANIQSSKVRPREVLYSQFVALLDEGKVQAARLESGTSKLYFDVKFNEATASTSDTSGSAAESVSKATDIAKAPAVASTPTSKSAAPTTSTSSPETSALTASTSSSGAASTFTHKMQKQYFIKLADKSDTLLINKVLSAGVEFAIIKTSFQGILANIFLSVLAVWLPLIPLIFVIRKIMEDRNSTSRKKKSSGAETVSITFSDVAGVDSAKQELAEVVSVMKATKAAYSKLKVKMPSGVLLCGPPGTGKTLLAKAVAGEAGIPFMAVSASEFVEMYVGRGAARIRELFAEARKVSPCVVFIDELDAVGARRGMGYNDERDQTLNQLLTELDGFEGRPGVLFLAATNRIDVLDPALLRPGRLSRKVLVPLPDEAGRQDILKVHLRGVPMLPDEDMADVILRLAKVTAGFSGAEIANVVNEGSLLAARKSQDHVTFRELLEGVQRTRYGVNGQTPNPTGSLQQNFNNWLMNLATDPSNRRVKNAVA
ncbi:hypothetical protein CEUSTIGMA_g8284.t1 [Chlamydomonas eustigma]|uniref:AAA+ ATPase domain-containing protein n=1 Tax=Chlamydomonas eustigma TaxID=1157962 RepID=A0A250XD76_9CHLO|nr:hypothetical protein CEUSTIGMA_g8284.t1 [Chlamydomonas eustigma]|eukprot:GAX80849.1 hypothetical protein CEUSTIGMA_g8284.t1 [Chlamydomonas eustigma]